MTLLDLVKLGGSELVSLALRGCLRPRHLWLAIQGAERYQEAVKTGDIAEQSEQDRRALKCASCRSQCRRGKDQVDATAIYCGPPLEEHEHPPTCGCLVALLVEGRAVPAGKTVVASEACPQGRWSAVPQEEAALCPTTR